MSRGRTSSSPRCVFMWMRLGVTLNVTDSEREALLDGDEDTLLKVLKEHRFSVDGNSYIPGCVAEEFRPGSDDVDFELPPTPIKY